MVHLNLLEKTKLANEMGVRSRGVPTAVAIYLEKTCNNRQQPPSSDKTGGVDKKAGERSKDPVWVMVVHAQGNNR